MKFATFAAFAASLVAAAPRVVQVHPSDIRPRRLGGHKFKLPQIHNDMFRQHGRGPRALAKAYEKYDIELPTDLVEIVQKILTELGINLPVQKVTAGHKPHGNGGAPYTNETDDQGTSLIMMHSHHYLVSQAS